MLKRYFLIPFSTILFLGLLASCNNDNENKNDGNKKEEEKTENPVVESRSLGLTASELKATWNEVYSGMEEKTGAFQIEDINVSNGEFKTNLGEGLIMEGIVDEDSHEIEQMSLIRKNKEDENLEQALNGFANTMTAYYLLVAITNKDKDIREEDIGDVLDDLDIFDNKEDGISGDATLNDVEYKSKENERGLVVTASPKKEKKKKK